MATIYERFNNDGSSSARVLIRRKDLPVLSVTFTTMEEAKRWAKSNEYKYINDPDLYLTWIKEERINLRRKREFER